ncbi:MAG: hypothetical protein KA123_00385 [Candidatus Eisenbacteria bacterium]|nr:hypothetical protein [Candidatus Eisenbacteria bacterium]
MPRCARMRSPIPSLLICVAGLLFGQAGPLFAQSDPGQAPRISNKAAPPSVERVALEELWRAGGESDEEFFGAISQAVMDAEGRIYLLDSQLSQVPVYSPTGERLRVLSREGEGPGEIRGASDLMILPGNRLAVIQTFPGRAVLLDLEGHPAGGFSVGGSDPSQGSFGALVTGRANGGNLVVGGIAMTLSGSVGGQRYFLASVNEQGVEQVRYLEKDSPIDYANFVASEEGFDFIWNRWDLAPDGRVFFAPARDRYEIEVRRPDGSIEKVIEREYSFRARNEKEKKEARLVLEAVTAYYPAPPRDLVVMNDPPVVVSIHCRPDGELWVRTSRGDTERPAGVLALYDAFDPAGKLRRQVALAGEGDPNEDAIFLLGDDRVLVVTQALEGFRTMQGVTSEEAQESEPMEAICYRMKAR